MRTDIPTEIKTVAEAKVFLQELHSNQEAFHPEDNPAHVAWSSDPPTPEQCRRLSRCMEQIYSLPEYAEYMQQQNAGVPHAQNTGFDPCAYLLELDEVPQD